MNKIAVHYNFTEIVRIILFKTPDLYKNRRIILENESLIDCTLPEDFLKESLEKDTPVFMLNYQSTPNNTKSKVILTGNLFSFLLEGSKSINYARDEARIDPNQFLMLSSGNCLMSERKASENGLFRSILMFFDNKSLTDFFIRYPAILAKSNAVRQKEPFIVFQKDDFLWNFINSLGLILSADSQTGKALSRLKFEELMIYLCNTYPEKVLSLRTSFQEIEDDIEIRKVVEANIESNVSIEELAFMCNNSLSTFKRRFAKIYGTTPHKWMLQKRMELAARLLDESETIASEIYYRVGYENLSSFIQSFKQVHGLTPKQYQMRI